jgi:C4-dicarboxylate-specific signal transduction histidine kinase
MSVHNQDLQREAPPGGDSGGASGERPLQLEDLVYINRMCTVGHVLPAVAHELNNALQVIGGLVELLGMKGELPPDVRDKVQKIGLQSNRSAGMMREFVAFARRDETAAAIDVQKAIEHALAMRRYHLSRARIEVLVDAPAEPLPIRADSHAVLQVLLNLTINAEEALHQMPQGQRELRFVVTSDANTVACTVRDSGPGFGDATKAHAPKPFFSTKTQGAAGLGLTVAEALVALDKGVLRVAEGPGGVVEVRWPRA